MLPVPNLGLCQDGGTLLGGNLADRGEDVLAVNVDRSRRWHRSFVLSRWRVSAGYHSFGRAVTLSRRREGREIAIAFTPFGSTFDGGWGVRSRQVRGPPHCAPY